MTPHDHPPAGIEPSLADPTLWDFAWGSPEVDPDRLAGALERAMAEADVDFRTRLLIRDCADSLKSYWGDEQWRGWLSAAPNRQRIETILREDLGEKGFHLSKEKLVPATTIESVRDYLRELGTRIGDEVTIEIGGAIALILAGLISRATADIDLVDEVPDVIRSRRDVLADLARRYGLTLTHFKSHFLPEGWRQRLRSLGGFGKLSVSCVDPIDIFICKLFSARTKDLDDLRALRTHFERSTLADRLNATTLAFLSEPVLHENAERNWYILYGEPLPAAPL